MTAQEKLLQDVVKSQEEMFSMRFNAVLNDIKEQMRDLDFDVTALDSITCRLLPNVTVYVDYVIRGFSHRIIELDRVDILNKDDDHLPKAEKSLMSALQCVLLELNEEAEQECQFEREHRDYVMHGLYY